MTKAKSAGVVLLSVFKPFQKIPRLNRDIVISEKIDGTNGTVIIDDHRSEQLCSEPPKGVAYVPYEEEMNIEQHAEFSKEELKIGRAIGTYIVRAASKNRICVPGMDDNFGFAAWVMENAGDLAHALGAGQFSGEWYGHGIGRGYGLQKGDRRFAFFNPTLDVPECAEIAPVLYQGARLLPSGECAVNFYIRKLSYSGSEAVRGWKQPEGVVIYHTAAGNYFKVTIEADNQHKSEE